MHLKDATILVVDDEVALLTIFGSWLEREGCRVLLAEHGRKGLELATCNNIDLVISDVRMPVMNGIDMAKRLMSEGAYLPKVVFVSGFSDLAERDCYDLGIEAMLHKPIKRSRLVSAVEQCLMDRQDLWRQSPTVPAELCLAASFNGLTDAVRREQIAFGRGGFCMHTDFAAQVGDAVRLDLRFTGDGQAIVGQGIVRWVDQGERMIGIEFTHVEDGNRAWTAGLAALTGSKQFIPRATSRSQTEAAHVG